MTLGILNELKMQTLFQNFHENRIFLEKKIEGTKIQIRFMKDQNTLLRKAKETLGVIEPNEVLFIFPTMPKKAKEPNGN